jgi:hypothetical protein
MMGVPELALLALLVSAVMMGVPELALLALVAFLLLIFVLLLLLLILHLHRSPYSCPARGSGA